MTNMREIKFRAWDTIRNEMIFAMSEGLRMHDITEGYTQMRFMQYTGLKDKNGVEIYEGDVVQSGTYTRVVVIEDGHSRLKPHYADTSFSSLTKSGIKTYKHEVIGNIYENTALINND